MDDIVPFLCGVFTQAPVGKGNRVLRTEEVSQIIEGNSGAGPREDHQVWLADKEVGLAPTSQ